MKHKIIYSILRLYLSLKNVKPVLINQNIYYAFNRLSELKNEYVIKKEPLKKKKKKSSGFEKWSTVDLAMQCLLVLKNDVFLSFRKK